MTRTPKFFTCEEVDFDGALFHQSADAAIEEYLNKIREKVRTRGYGDWLDELPECLTIRFYAPMEPNVDDFADRVLTHLLEAVDEQYGDPDGNEENEPTDDMEAAAKVFVKAVLKECHIWACEEIGSDNIDPLEWISKNRPLWMPKEWAS